MPWLLVVDTEVVSHEFFVETDGAVRCACCALRRVRRVRRCAILIKYIIKIARGRGGCRVRYAQICTLQSPLQVEVDSLSANKPARQRRGVAQVPRVGFPPAEATHLNIFLTLAINWNDAIVGLTHKR